MIERGDSEDPKPLINAPGRHEVEERKTGANDYQKDHSGSYLGQSGAVEGERRLEYCKHVAKNDESQPMNIKKCGEATQ